MQVNLAAEFNPDFLKLSIKEVQNGILEYWL